MEQKIGSRDETEMNMEASEIEREMVKARYPGLSDEEYNEALDLLFRGKL